MTHARSAWQPILFLVSRCFQDPVQAEVVGKWWLEPGRSLRMPSRPRQLPDVHEGSFTCLVNLSRSLDHEDFWALEVSFENLRARSTTIWLPHAKSVSSSRVGWAALTASWQHDSIPYVVKRDELGQTSNCCCVTTAFVHLVVAVGPSVNRSKWLSVHILTVGFAERTIERGVKNTGTCCYHPEPDGVGDNVANHQQRQKGKIKQKASYEES